MHETLNRVFGFRSFRPKQKEIISALLSGRDVFAVMPVGSGRSLCYQLPTFKKSGFCMVVGPQVPFPKDRAESVAINGFKGAFLHGRQSEAERKKVYSWFELGAPQILYVTPDCFLMADFIAFIRRIDISVFVIEQADRISKRSERFEPDYRQLTSIMPMFPHAAFLALTDVVDSTVQTDIIQHLCLRSPDLIRATFDHPNLSIKIGPKKSLNEQLLAFLKARKDEPGIIFRSSREAVELTTQYLSQRGIEAVQCYAGLAPEVLKRQLDYFNHDDTKVMISTSGSLDGLEKTNIRFVVHGDLPRSVERYYRDISLAGRDGSKADCALFFQPNDAAKTRFLIEQVEEGSELETDLKKLEQMLQVAQSDKCRRTSLLECFGERYPKGNCAGCNVCSGDTELVDLTDEARIVTSAVYRSGQEFGLAHIVEIVTGANTEAVLKHRHNRLTAYGKGKARDRSYWRDLVGRLIKGDILQMSGTRSALTLTKNGEKFAAAKGKVRFCVRQQKKAKKNAAIAPDWFCEGLYRALQQERTDVALENDVVPYVVFSDRSLREMARYFPSNFAQMRKITGVGVFREERYGRRFIDAIQAYASEHPDEAVHKKAFLSDEIRAEAKRVPRNDIYSETLQLVRKGHSLDEIARIRRLSPGTVFQHIEKLVNDGEDLSIDQFVSPDNQVAIEELFKRLGSREVKPVVQASQGKLNYIDVRLALLFKGK